MDLFTRQDALDYVEAQAELLATHFSSVLGMQVTIGQARTVLSAMHRPEGQCAGDVAPESVATCALDTVALAIDAKTLLRKARDRGASFGNAISVFTENCSPLERAYSDYACENLVSEGDLEFDEGCPASLSEENGAYVQGWKWVPRGALPAFDSVAANLLYGFRSLKLEVCTHINEELHRRSVSTDERALEAMLRGEVLDDNVVLAHCETKAGVLELTAGLARQLNWSQAEGAFLRHTDKARAHYDVLVKFDFCDE